MTAESVSSSQGSNKSTANLRSLNQDRCSASSSSVTSNSFQSMTTTPATVNSVFSVDILSTLSPIQPIPMLGSAHRPSSILISETSGNIPDSGHQGTNSSFHHLNGFSLHGSNNQSSRNPVSAHHHHLNHFQSVSQSFISSHEAMRRGRYTCPICLKAFSEKGNMKRHTLIHLPQRHRYQCDLCSKGFSWKDNFNRHRRSHHI